MRFLKSRLLTSIIVSLTSLMCIAVGVLAMNVAQETVAFRTPYMFLNGEYSADGKEFKSFDPNEPINDHFKKITFKGTLIPKDTGELWEEITFTTKNMWYSLYSADGELLLTNSYQTLDQWCDEYFDTDDGEEYTEEEKEEYKKRLLSKNPFKFDMPDTPGYSEMIMEKDEFEDSGIDLDSELIIEFEIPYDISLGSFSDLFTVTMSDGNGIHMRILKNILPIVFLFAIVCMFGIFFFPVASFILGRINYKYLSFGILCFFWGLYMMMQAFSNFLGHWITDNTVCLFLDKMTAHFFAITLIVYLQANLTKPVSKAISGALTMFVCAAVITSAALHLTCKADMIVTGVYLNIIIGITAVAFIVMLSYEVKSSRSALLSMILWTPMIIGLVVDIADQFIGFPGSHYFIYGFAVTMVAQIVFIVFDLRKQRLEAIRYQQMQKELYEAKVQVMVSQIRPHFMYNALSSIAMLCKLKPDTAYEATIKFSDYLRGNMDSLKQTAPVPFSKELEHLEKYLYIEKLRFGKKLNIEYDIQAEDFVLPLLSVQPLVENAVKHGVGMKEDGGTVTISTRETEENYEIIVSDDGVGFDTNEVKNDGRSHIGMENTKRRLKDMCNGEVEITSVIGEGTTAKIIIPKVKEETE